MRSRSGALILGFCFASLSIASALAEGCADQLTADSKSKEVIACLKEQQSTIAALRQSLLTWNTDQVVGNEVGSGDQEQPTTCPKDSYAVGINWWGAPGTTHFCVGCLSGIQIVCRKLAK
jgi:hypothetical protein